MRVRVSDKVSEASTTQQSSEILRGIHGNAGFGPGHTVCLPASCDPCDLTAGTVSEAQQEDRRGGLLAGTFS